MHQEIRDYLSGIKTKHPEYFANKEVLEAGSLNINGSPKEYFEHCIYCGIDVGPGKGVDFVSPVHLLKGITSVVPLKTYESFDVVVSTEMLEHDSNWDLSLKAMVDLVRPGGMLIVTCAGPVRKEHGTTDTDTYSSPHTTDYYRNLDIKDFIDHIPCDDFDVYDLQYGRNMEDIMFYGIKKDIKYLQPSNHLSDKTSAENAAGVTVCIPTKNRYDVLHLCLLSIALQTLPPKKVFIVDDSDTPMDLRNDSNYLYVLRLLSDKGIDWEVKYGAKKGQHHSHQMVQELATTNLIFRIDDDEIAEPNVLEMLAAAMQDSEIGAVAPCVLMPNAESLPAGLENKIASINSPNIQWFKWSGTIEAEHLYSCFMYRKGITKYELALSTVAHREETLFTHSIFKAGYKLVVLGDIRVWHFRGATGGIRSNNDQSLWEHDETIFRNKFKEWGVAGSNNFMIVLDSGLGDHYALKKVLPLIRQNHKDITIAACFPDAFFDEPDIKLISIAEAKLIYGNIDQFNIYKYMWDHNWNKSLSAAFAELYLNL